MREGDMGEGDMREGDMREGDMREGDMREGDMREGDRREVDRREGDMREGDMREGEMREGDMSRCSYGSVFGLVTRARRAGDLPKAVYSKIATSVQLPCSLTKPSWSCLATWMLNTHRGRKDKSKIPRTRCQP